MALSQRTFAEAAALVASTGKPQLFRHMIQKLPESLVWKAKKQRRVLGGGRLTDDSAAFDSGDVRTLSFRRLQSMIKSRGGAWYCCAPASAYAIDFVCRQDAAVPLTSSTSISVSNHPFLFGTAGSESAVHEDAIELGFALVAVVSGEKRVAFWQDDPDLCRGPRGARGSVSMDVPAGWGVLIPAGVWHRVTNVEDTTGVATGFDLARPGTRRWLQKWL